MCSMPKKPPPTIARTKKPTPMIEPIPAIPPTPIVRRGRK
jgi:hypothetical protein